MDGLGLFAVGGDVAADGGEAGGAGGAAELAADLGLKLDHAQVAFGLVVVERQGQVAGVGEEQVAVLAERDGEVSGVFVRPVQVGARDCRRRSAGGPFAEGVPSSPDPALLVGLQRWFACGAGGVGSSFIP